MKKIFNYCSNFLRETENNFFVQNKMFSEKKFLKKNSFSTFSEFKEEKSILKQIKQINQGSIVLVSALFAPYFFQKYHENNKAKEIIYGKQKIELTKNILIKNEKFEKELQNHIKPKENTFLKVIYGYPRIGKTTTIKKIFNSNSKNLIYLNADIIINKTDEKMVEEFNNQLGVYDLNFLVYLEKLKEILKLKEKKQKLDFFFKICDKICNKVKKKTQIPTSIIIDGAQKFSLETLKTILQWGKKNLDENRSSLTLILSDTVSKLVEKQLQISQRVKFINLSYFIEKEDAKEYFKIKKFEKHFDKIYEKVSGGNLGVIIDCVESLETNSIDKIISDYQIIVDKNLREFKNSTLANIILKKIYESHKTSKFLGISEILDILIKEGIVVKNKKDSDTEVFNFNDFMQEITNLLKNGIIISIILENEKKNFEYIVFSSNNYITYYDQLNNYKS
jgi:hypothetical protein